MKKDDQPVKFVPLKEYVAPGFPVDELAGNVIGFFKRLIQAKDDSPFIEDHRLRKTSRQVLDEFVSPPACGPLILEMDQTLECWQKTTDSPATKLVILPPGDANNLVATWAKKKVLQIIDPPKRQELPQNRIHERPDLNGEGLLVIPNLERWFLRHHNGLELVASLLTDIHSLDRSCVIGCESWGWSFLSRAIGADLVLPEAITFKAFDGERLENWFSELACDEETRDATFRLASNGDVILEHEGVRNTRYFSGLAARSLGIPWVAWHLWRRSLRYSIDSEPNSESARSKANDDRKTLWIAEPETFRIPARYKKESVLTLHALLIHGSLSLPEIRLVLPSNCDNGVIWALISSGLVEKDRDQFRCPPEAYPSIRRELKSAGITPDDFN